MKLIFFLSGINLIASAYTAALPALILPKASGGEGKGSGAAMLPGILGIAGVLVCTVFNLLLRRNIQQEKLKNI